MNLRSLFMLTLVALAGKGTREAQSASEKLEQLSWR